MSNIHYRLHKQIDDASKRFQKDGAIWTIEIMKKMVENSKDYDSDVIEEIKSYIIARESKITFHKPPILPDGGVGLAL